MGVDIVHLLQVGAKYAAAVKCILKLRLKLPHLLVLNVTLVHIYYRRQFFLVNTTKRRIAFLVLWERNGSQQRQSVIFVVRVRMQIKREKPPVTIVPKIPIYKMKVLQPVFMTMKMIAWSVVHFNLRTEPSKVELRPVYVKVVQLEPELK